MPTLEIVLAFVGEGTTDERFITNISERLVQQILLDNGVEATIQWQKIAKHGHTSMEIIFNAALQAKHCTALIIHADADDSQPDDTWENKLRPGFDAVENSTEEICKHLVPIIPASEIEAWMLVDRELLKAEMNTTCTNQQLGLTYLQSRVEEIRDPKQKLLNAIHVHHQQMPSKRRRSAVTIAELYEPISQKIPLEQLEVLDAYLVFKEKVITALRNQQIIR